MISSDSQFSEFVELITLMIDIIIVLNSTFIKFSLIPVRRHMSWFFFMLTWLAEVRKNRTLQSVKQIYKHKISRWTGRMFCTLYYWQNHVDLRCRKENWILNIEIVFFCPALCIYLMFLKLKKIQIEFVTGSCKV